MKIAIATILLVASTMTYAYSCYTQCYWVGNRQVCNTTCR